MPNSCEEYVEIYKSSVHSYLSMSAVRGDNISSDRMSLKISVVTLSASSGGGCFFDRLYEQGKAVGAKTGTGGCRVSSFWTGSGAQLFY